MTFQIPLRYTNGEIDRAGLKLKEGKVRTNDYKEALSLLNNWRASHSYVMNTFVSTLHKKTASFKNVIIAQRLKRLPTILDKINRYPDMRLSRMQDIGGVRAILDNIGDVRKLEEDYLTKGRLPHELLRHDDYIVIPKDDGYRGVHLSYRYDNTLARNDLAKLHKGLKVEMQIRTHLQHSWSTAVEAMGMFLGESFKTGSGDNEWREFFALCSTAFAFAEKTPPCPQHEDIPIKEVYRRIRDLDNKLSARQHIKDLTRAAFAINQHIRRRPIKRRLHYTIISLNLDKKEIAIWAFTRDQLNEANTKLVELEKRHGNFDQVLVSVSNLMSLKAAYPNYFLDMDEFTSRIDVIIEELNKTGI